MTLFILCFALLVAQADRAILAQMQGEDVRVLERVPVDPAFDLVVALGAAKGWTTGTGEGGWWDQNRQLGLFLQRRDRPGLVYRIAIESGKGDCYARVERATSTGVVISCTPEKGSSMPMWKFVYDLRAKALVNRIDYEHFALQRVFRAGRKTVMTGSLYERLVAVEYDADRNAFRVLSGAVEPPNKPANLGPAGRFALPKSFHTIGPSQVAGDAFWFANTWPFGDPVGGVGGFGYFDSRQGKYRTWFPPEMHDWQASAMLVEPDAVWLGLVHHGEWRDSSGGLLRFDSATEKVERIDLRDIANGIVRAGGRLLIATDFGAALLEGGKLRRFFVDRTSDGRLRVVEAKLGN